MAHRVDAVVRHLAPQAAAAPAPQKQYKYTQPTAEGILTPEQRDFYEKNGFIIIPNLVSKEKIAQFRDRFLAICNGAQPGHGMLVMRDVAIAKKKEMGEKAITKVQDIQNDELFAYCELPEVVRYATAFCGPNVAAMHTMLINKPPDVGLGSSRHPPHQDLWYFPFRPAEKIVAAWTAMQTINLENGCLVVEPGSHREDLQYHTYPNDGIVNKAYHGIQGRATEEAASKMFPVIMNEGDTVFFHPQLVHGSGRNNSPHYRKAISCHYASSTDCRYVLTEGTIQEELDKEITEIARLKTGLEIPYQDIWRAKARLVAGVDGELTQPPSGNYKVSPLGTKKRT